jgi:hypothetical protein
MIWCERQTLFPARVQMDPRDKGLIFRNGFSEEHPKLAILEHR